MLEIHIHYFFIQRVFKSHLKKISLTQSANFHPKSWFDLSPSYINVLKNGSTQIGGGDRGCKLWLCYLTKMIPTIWNSHVFCVLHKVSYCKNNKIRFLWNHDNGKIDCISGWWYAYAPLKIFDISFSKPPSRNPMFIQPMYNEDKIISFLYTYIYFNLHIYCIKR